MMLPKPYRLPSHKIAEVIKKGKRVHAHLCSLIVFPKQTSEPSQFAVIVPQQLSKKATKRNRSKRLLVEAIHHNLTDIGNGFEIIVMAKKLLLAEKLQDITPIITHLLKKANLFKR